MPTAPPIFLDNAKTCLIQDVHVPLTTVVTVTDSCCVDQRGPIVLPKRDSFVLMKSIYIRDLVIGIILHAFVSSCFRQIFQVHNGQSFKFVEPDLGPNYSQRLAAADVRSRYH